jgi:RHS repeat-associated protein
MPTRTWSDPNSKYKYGFNGKEIDKGDEGMGGGGSTYDYGFRIYNSNLGRFLSVDPLSKSYPWYTPYQFAGNKPIRCVDLDGLEELSVTVENNPAQPFISQATIVITMQYTIVTSGRGAVSGLDPKAFHDKYALGNTTLIMSQLPTAGHEGVALTGYQLKWAKKALAGNERAMRRLKKDGIDQIYKTEVQYDYTLDVSPNTTLEGALEKMSQNIQGRGVIMEAIPDANMLASDGPNLKKVMTDANDWFKKTNGGGWSSNEVYNFADNYIILPISTNMTTSKTDNAVHEAGHNSSILHQHTYYQTGDYEYFHKGLANNGVGNGGTLIYPTEQNTINIINDLSNRAKAAVFATSKTQ